MKESYGEGLASHSDPKSCAGDREVSGEALIGAHIGGQIELRNAKTRMPTLLPDAEGTILGRVMRVHEGSGGVIESRMCGKSKEEDGITRRCPTHRWGVGTRREHGSGNAAMHVPSSRTIS